MDRSTDLDVGGSDVFVPLRLRAAVTMRVMAMGEIAFDHDARGAVRPSCQVSEATARSAQPYAPVSAGPPA